MQRRGISPFFANPPSLSQRIYFMLCTQKDTLPEKVKFLLEAHIVRPIFFLISLTKC